jgi:hypothetical protein
VHWCSTNHIYLADQLSKANINYYEAQSAQCMMPDGIGSDRIGSDRIGSDRIGSDRIGSDRMIGSKFYFEKLSACSSREVQTLKLSKPMQP